jgi:hypothetical protein
MCCFVLLFSANLLSPSIFSLFATTMFICSGAGFCPDFDDGQVHLVGDRMAVGFLGS